MDDDLLFGPGFARRLERLKWILRKRIAGGGEGEKAGRRKGGLIEFADHRDYVPGDDPRYIDWNAYSRLDILTVKEFAKEEEVPLTLLLDVSASMGAGSPEKFKLALRAAAALGFIALASRNPVSVLSFRAGERRNSRVFRGQGAIFDLMKLLETFSSAGRTDLMGALRECGALGPARGLVVLISDLMDAGGFQTGLAGLSARGREVCVLQILSPLERSPSLEGPLTLVDAETGETMDLDLTPHDLETFRKARGKQEENLRRFAFSRGFRYVAVRSDAPPEDVALQTLREANWLRFR